MPAPGILRVPSVREIIEKLKGKEEGKTERRIELGKGERKRNNEEMATWGQPKNTRVCAMGLCYYSSITATSCILKSDW